MEKKALSNQSIVKAFAIVELMASQHEDMRLQDISQLSGIPASTALRILNTMQRLGYVSQNRQTSQYRLTLKFGQISEAVASRFDLRGLVHPHLIALSQATGESSCLAIEQDMTVVYVDVVSGQDSMIKTMQYIGKTAPMHSTGIGKLLLGEYSEEKLDHYIEQKQLLPLTANTITTKAALVKELKTIAKQGYALDDEECELGARCLAAPLRDHRGKIIACISVSGPTFRMQQAQLATIQPLIVDIAGQISSAMAYDSHNATQC